MTKSILLSMLALSLSFGLSSEPWKLSADAGLTLNQGAYSDNWAGSELGSISWTANLNAAAEKQFHPLFHDKTTLKLAFGQTHQQKLDANGDKHWAKPEKSTDKIDLESVLRITLQGWVDPFVSGRWESQFVDYSDPLKTRIVNPSLFSEGVGISRAFIAQKDHNLSARLGVAMRQNVDRDRLTPSTEDPGHRETWTTNDGGVQFVADYDRVIPPGAVTYKSRLQAYQALFNSKEDELPNGRWKAVDFTWEHTLTAKLWKSISMNAYFELLYDKQQRRQCQWKETLGFNLSYRLL